jgi:hypothetical protein
VQIQSIVPSGNISTNPAPVATTAAGIYVINNLGQNNGDDVAVSCSASVSQTYSSTTTNSVNKQVSPLHLISNLFPSKATVSHTAITLTESSKLHHSCEDMQS